jgi:5'-nucleotidase
MRILLSNDDGPDAAGLKYAARALDLHDVEIVVPLHDSSGGSHSTTRDRALTVTIRDVEGIAATVVAGTPADAIKFKLYHAARPFDVVVSGFNAGENGGCSHFYSGTVAAAREAALRGVSAISVSVWRDDPDHYLAAGQFIRMWLPRWFAPQQANRPAGSALLNVNFPDCHPGEIRGIRIARQSIAYHDDGFLRTAENGQDAEYAIRLGDKNANAIVRGTDDWALRHGYVTIVPLRVEVTCAAHLAWLKELHSPSSDSDPRDEVA